MKNNYIFRFFFFIIIFSGYNAVSQSSYCENLGFENGNFDNWEAYTWVNSTISGVQSTSPKPDFSMQTIKTNQGEYDPNTGNKLKVIPTGYKYSARLGDLLKNTSVATLRYTMKVDSQNSLLIYKFAVVLLNPTSGHEKYEEPRFKVTLYDENNLKINDCSNYDVYASDAELSKSFNTFYASSNSEPVLWRDWTTVGINLTAYIGKTITIEFLAADCTHKGHYGYAYFVASCQPAELFNKYCEKDIEAYLSAPDGFTSYLWKSESGATIGNSKNISVKNPAEDKYYYCEMVSATGCTVSMKTKIAKYKPKANFVSSMLDCHSNEVQFTNQSTTNYGEMIYFWDFGDGQYSNSKDPKYKFNTSGLHEVKLFIYVMPSTCPDTMIKTVESFSPPLVGITGDTTYCPGYSTTIYSYGAAIYNWSNGTKADSIVIGKPGGKYWMLGKSTTGCISDTLHFNISEDPYWPFIINNPETICKGDTIELEVSPALDYLWNTGETTSKIKVFNNGNYYVIGKNKRGCVKKADKSVIFNELPSTSIIINPGKIDKNNNTVFLKVGKEETGTSYYWNLGDGTSQTGNQFIHTYDLSKNQTGYYLINLLAVSEKSCVDSSSIILEILPFIPNIFSPDNDGKNDHWKVNISDYYANDVEAAIFDRWGEKIIEWKNIKTLEWDGKFHDSFVITGVYTYIIKCRNIKNEEVIFSGDITVLR